jgi:hypothetical protein
MPTKSTARSCRTKKLYPTEELAIKRASSANCRGVHIKPYKCQVCSGWHMTGRNRVSVLQDLFKKIERERLVKAP